MPKLHTIGQRLEKCAAFVEPGAALADIGTDHGYLPIRLLLQGRVRSAIAADIGAGPLSCAASNAARYGVELKTIRSDGFQTIPPDAFDTAVLAGMGGELMVRLIREAAFLKDRNKRLILQPMTSAHILRRFLLEEGFCLKREEAVREGDKLYTVLLASYTGEKRSPSPLEAHMGALVPGAPCSGAYGEKVISRQRKELIGARRRGDSEREVFITALIREIQETYHV